jgi:hypothetical protein
MDGLFAIAVGVLTIARGEAWVGRTLPQNILLKGPITVLIGTLAVGVGLLLMIAP